MIAGALGTIAMDALWYRRYRNEGGNASPLNWEFHPQINSFDDAPAPAKVAKHIAVSLHVELPDSSATASNNVMHWATGLSWGIAATLLHTMPRIRAFDAGLLASIAAFATSYTVLPRLHIYNKITDYDTTTLVKDLSAHLLFGATVGLVSSITSQRD